MTIAAIDAAGWVVIIGAIGAQVVTIMTLYYKLRADKKDVKEVKEEVKAQTEGMIDQAKLKVKEADAKATETGRAEDFEVAQLARCVVQKLESASTDRNTKVTSKEPSRETG